MTTVQPGQQQLVLQSFLSEISFAWQQVAFQVIKAEQQSLLHVLDGIYKQSQKIHIYSPLNVETEPVVSDHDNTFQTASTTQTLEHQHKILPSTKQFVHQKQLWTIPSSNSLNHCTKAKINVTLAKSVQKHPKSSLFYSTGEPVLQLLQPDRKSQFKSQNRGKSRDILRQISLSKQNNILRPPANKLAFLLSVIAADQK